MLDLRRAITCSFRSRGWWRAALLGSLLVAIPHVGFLAAQAFLLPVAARVAAGERDDPPNWRAWGKLPRDAAALLAVYLLIGAALVAATLIFVFGVGAALFLAAIVTAGSFRDDWVVQPLALLFVVTAFILLIPLSQVGVARLAATGTIRESLDLRTGWAMLRAKPGPWGAAIVAPLVVSSLVAWPPRLVGVNAGWADGPWRSLIASPIAYWLVAMNMHLLGQAHRGSAAAFPTREQVRERAFAERDVDARFDAALSHPVLYDAYRPLRRPPVRRRPPS